MKRIFDDKLYGNATYLMATTVMNSALGFVFWYIIARLYPPSEVGLATVIISSMTLLAMLSTLGFDIGLMRFLPQAGGKESNRIISSCLTLGFLISLILSLIYLAGIEVWSPVLIQLKQDVFFAAFFIIFTSIWLLGLLIDSVFIAKCVAGYVFVRSIIFSFLKILISLIVVSWGAFGIFFSWGAASLIAIVVSIMFLFPKILRECRLKFSVYTREIDHMIHFSFGNYMANLMGSTTAMILPIMIANMMEPEMAAYFYISWMIAFFIFMIPIAVSNSLLATVSADEEGFWINLKKAFLFAYAFVLPSVVLFFFIGGFLLSFFGDEYSANGSPVLRILVLSGIPYTLNVIYITVNNILKRVRMVIALNTLIAFITLSLSYVFIGLGVGLEGVAYAWLISQLVIACFVAYKSISWWGRHKKSFD